MRQNIVLVQHEAGLHLSSRRLDVEEQLNIRYVVLT